MGEFSDGFVFDEFLKIFKKSIGKHEKCDSTRSSERGMELKQNKQLDV